MKQKILGQKINWWKWGFLLLFAINIGFISVVMSRLIQPREPNNQQTLKHTTNSVKVGTFTMHKEELNNTIAAFLKDYQSKDFSYQIYVASSSILFEGSYTLLGYEVPLYVYFEPVRLSNGAVQLKVTSFSVGTLSLPQKEVLQYIKTSYKLPDIVVIDPQKATITINLQNLKNDAGLYLKATSIDLVNDQFTFDIFKKKSASKR
ncbi:YpmS family protein [Streptococcus sciuri]|uniref:YpmS family protein n=1 Tax=Streptococcus sciuri TaxID=2973939 RepID=A0ABT2F6H6_9STRE|nr:YpmS family protein [Streptococcus sciuri]MCS4488076.1 YpmS family protein [Streptococcus sciuri]